ncbi:protein G12 [Drosophila obscura]|uniref:protein G12 n=1 Tax=Drosophila obscura TaxID=7282 RepID=UPI001BB23AE2|nr:protein G12 [Drosophila obscura]
MAFFGHVPIAIFLLGVIFSCAPTFADLRADLRDFVAIAPRRRIGYIAARYYIFDPRFRQAVGFLRSDEFLKTWQEVRAAPDVAALIDYLNEYGSGYEVTSLVDNLPQRLRNFQLSRTVPVEMMLHRDLTTFLREAVQTLPRAKVYALMSQKVRQGGDFAKFYKALRDKQFKTLVDRARNSSDLLAPLKRLKAENINVDEIIQILFEIINWGPQNP